VRLGAAGAVGALVHLAARAEVADLRVLRRAERAGIEAVAAADADVLRVQHHRVRGGEDRAGRADRLARRVGAVHAGHRHRALARLAVIERDDAPAVDAPRHLVLVLAGGNAGVAFDATIGVAEEFHPSHGPASLCRPDLTQGDLGVLHSGRRSVAVGRDRVRAFAEHDRIGALRIVVAQVLAAEPATEVERHPGDALAHALGDERLHSRLGAVLGTRHPDPAAVLDAALGGVRRIDLDEHVLLQLGEPRIGPRLLAAALVFDQAAGAEDQRVFLRDALVDRRLLNAEADVRQAELTRVGQGRIFADQVDARRVDRLAGDGDRVGQAERIHARLGIAERRTAVLECHPLNPAGQIDRPRDGVGLLAADLLDRGKLFGREVRVPAELLEHRQGEL